MKVVGFLQNAWSPHYAGRHWPRERWLWALANSRTGQRLRTLEKECENRIEFYWENTTPVCGMSPSSVIAPDMRHMVEVVQRERPKYLVSFGQQAERAVRELMYRCPWLILPHPAYRVVTNELFREAGKLLAGRMGLNGITRLVQLKDGVWKEHLADRADFPECEAFWSRKARQKVAV